MTLLLALLATHFTVQAANNSLDKTSAYQRALTKDAIQTHGDKYKPTKKINNLNPLPHYQKPSLNGKFSHQQRYSAAKKTIKLHKKPTLSNQSPSSYRNSAHQFR